jgi:hypothetical protein
MTPEQLRQLQDWQRQIDLIADYAERVTTAKKQFENRNQKRNATFRAVRVALTEMCSGAQRCVYCEDSAADEVEHIKPKDLYPEEVFVWENYLYACGPCNGSKNSRFAVFSSAEGHLIEVARGKNDPITPPESGHPVFLNPRKENPLEFMTLDLRDTFWFLPLGEKGSEAFDRADYTIKILGLNEERPYLPSVRREAYEDYRARLLAYIQSKQEGASEEQLQSLISALRRKGHPTVWAEMKRQHLLIPELRDLFAQAPEALGW